MPEAGANSPGVARGGTSVACLEMGKEATNQGRLGVSLSEEALLAVLGTGSCHSFPHPSKTSVPRSAVL